MVSKSGEEGDFVRIGSFYYMKNSVAHSLYRNGKVLARRDKDGNDAGKEGMDLEARSMHMDRQMQQGAWVKWLPMSRR